MNYDLFYEEKGYPWHYDKPEYRFVNPIGRQWTLITENQNENKLNLFTKHFVPLKINIEKEKRENTASKIIKLWDEFEIFYEEIRKNGFETMMRG